MPKKYEYDAVIVGAGPNGLAAAITMARAGRSVLLLEAKATVGGGSRSAQLTLPGFVHDVCSAIHPLGAGSPFMRSLPLREYGLEWIFPPVALAHPLDNGMAALLQRSVMGTSISLRQDAPAYRKLMAPLVREWGKIEPAILAPLHIPRHPVALARFGVLAFLPAARLASLLFDGEPAQGMFAGLAAHSMLALDTLGTAAIALVLGILAHVVGWPVARGGSQNIADAMAAYLRSLGGRIETDRPIRSIDELPSAHAMLFDVTPRQLLNIAGSKLPPGYRKQLERYRYGPGVFKLDLALDGPIPWKAPGCALAATVHLGGTLAEIVASEKAVWQGKPPDKPFVLLAQQSLFDPSRVPQGKQTAWAYCHVPNGADFDMTARIEAQIERFAPGFRERILARHIMFPCDMQDYNANYIGGDINGGAQDLLQVFTRPTRDLRPYRTPVPGVYICSSSTPPGGGVHGLCGYFAARTALADEETKKAIVR